MSELTEKKPVVRTNPFKEDSRAYKLLYKGEAVLRWLATQPERTTRAANHHIAGVVGIDLDPGRSQSRRLNEALEALREAGLVETSYETPHPRKNPTGRVLSLTDAGAAFIGLPVPETTTKEAA
jgi:hypothetical protein